jgi:hypothetical protein
MSAIGTLLGCILVVVFLGGAVLRGIFEDPCEGSGNYRDTEHYYSNDYEYEDEDEDEDE